MQGTAAGKYASQLLKASCASYAKGLAPPALAGDTENSKQPEFYVEPENLCLQDGKSIKKEEKPFDFSSVVAGGGLEPPASGL